MCIFVILQYWLIGLYLHFVWNIIQIWLCVSHFLFVLAALAFVVSFVLVASAFVFVFVCKAFDVKAGVHFVGWIDRIQRLFGINCTPDSTGSKIQKLANNGGQQQDVLIWPASNWHSIHSIHSIHTSRGYHSIHGIYSTDSIQSIQSIHSIYNVHIVTCQPCR